MDHDIAHCRGLNCPIRDDCFRYQAHLEVASGKFPHTYLTYYVDSYRCEPSIQAESKL